MKSSSIWTFLACLAAIASAWWSFQLSHTPTIRFGAVAVAESNGALMLAYGYAMTVLGVALGSAYRNLQDRQKRGQKKIAAIGAFLRGVFTSIDFWLGLVASPLVYALLLRSTEGGSVSGLTAIALQNGFCCTVIVSGIMEKGGQEDGPAKPTGQD